MARDLENEDRIRELRGKVEWAQILGSAEPFQWFLGLVDAEVDKIRVRVESHTVSDRDVFQMLGAIGALKNVRGILDREVSSVSADLQALEVQ